MAKMLIRTRQYERKHRVATIVRVVLFFGIPIVYMVAKSIASNQVIVFDGKETLQQTIVCITKKSQQSILCFCYRT